MSMRSRAVVVVLSAAALLVAGVAVLIAWNAAPAVPTISDVEARATTTPYVVKLHARWCPICMATKDEWAALQEAYAGKVRLVVFDFTTNATTDATREEARRLGLENAFTEYAGETGTVLVIDGASKAVLHALHGHRDIAEYRSAIDAALRGE